MKAYIFDFDGTLVDSMGMWENMLKSLFSDKGVPFPDGIMKIITPLGQAEAVKYLTSLDSRLKEDEIVDFMYTYVTDQYHDKIQAKPYAAELVKQLHEENNKLFILTACAHELLDPCLLRLGIERYFDGVFTCEDFGYKKSDIEMYEKFCKTTGFKPADCYFFDDNSEALKTAKKAGMISCGIYDEISKDYVEEIKSFADMYLYDFHEFKPL